MLVEIVSRATVNELWAAGLDAARRTFAHPELWEGGKTADGIRVFDVRRVQFRFVAN